MKAVIFDLDGTLANTLSLCIAAFRKSIEPLAGIKLSDRDIMATFGPTEEGTINALVPYEYDQALSDYIKYYRDLHDMCSKPFDGIEEILMWLKSKGIIVGMVTGKGRLSCDITLDYFGITDCFDMIQTGSPLRQIKTEGIISILDKFGLQPNEAIYVGDAPSDITSSRRAGVPVASVAWAETTNLNELKDLNPDYIFTTIADFRKFLQKTIG